MANNIFNDIMYNEVLASDGFVVDYAICTTYSLDMPTLLSVPFMLGTMSELSKEAIRSPHCVLEAINKSAGKFAVFCNAGNIAVPQNLKTNIYSLLEKSIVQISLDTQGKGFVNFHPKVWIVKETNSDSKITQLKVVVMSRNLSASDDLDIVCELTGQESKREPTQAQQKKHKPLIDFLLWLKSHSSQRAIKNGIDEICTSLKRVATFDVEMPFCDYDFFPMGIEGYSGKDTCLSQMLDSASETLIISPFVDDNIIYHFTKSHPSTKKTLITRHSSITNRMINAINDGVYAVKEVMTDKTEKDTCVDIHEKVYFIRNGKNLCNYLYLGSTNATTNGFDRNVEFLLRLQFKPYCMSYERFRNELIYDDKGCMFEEVTQVPEQEEQSQEEIKSEIELYRAIRAIHHAKVSRENNIYTVSICCNKHIANVAVMIYPLYCPLLRQELNDGITFRITDLSSLSEFYVIEVGQVRRVIKIDTTGIPTEERNKAIFQSIINTKSKFINYLAFMLTDSPEEFIAESQQIEKDFEHSETTGNDLIMTSSLYEDMVKAAYQSPEKIESIKSIIEKADKRIIPEDFEQMYAQFLTAIKNIKRL